MDNILILVKNTLKITFRKKGNILIYLILPVLGILLSMMIYSGVGSSSIGIGLVDNDASRLSKDFAAAISQSGSYKLESVNEVDISARLAEQKYEAVIVIPKGYEEGIYNNAVLSIELTSLKGKETTAWLESFINLHTQNLAGISIASDGSREAFEEMYKLFVQESPNVGEVRLEDVMTGKSVTLSSVGFLIMFVMLGASFTSQLMLNEKKDRTYYRICSSPVNPKEYIAGNMLSSLAIVAAQVILILLLMKFVFRIETFVPMPVMFLILILFGMVAIGIGLVVTAYSSTSYMAGTLSTLVMTPTCMLGGCFWSVSYMPDMMQKIARLMPQWWAIDAVQNIQNGKLVGDIAMNFAILAAFAAALMLIAIYKLSRRDDVKKFV